MVKYTLLTANKLFVKAFNLYNLVHKAQCYKCRFMQNRQVSFISFFPFNLLQILITHFIFAPAIY